MIKETRLEALEELKQEFETINKTSAWVNLYTLISRDYLPNDADVYEVNNSNYYTSMINGWTSHVEKTKHYYIYVEMIKEVNNKIISKWVKIEHDKKDLLIKLYEILNND